MAIKQARWLSSKQDSYQASKMAIKQARWLSSKQDGYQASKMAIKQARWLSSNLAVRQASRLASKQSIDHSFKDTCTNVQMHKMYSPLQQTTLETLNPVSKYEKAT